MKTEPVLIHFRDFCKDLRERNFSEETVRAISVDLRGLEKYIQNRPDIDLTKENVLSKDIVLNYIAEGETEATIVRRLYSLRRWVAHAIDKDFVDTDFLQDVGYKDFLKEGAEEQPPSVLTADEADRLVKFLQEMFLHEGHFEMYLLVSFMLSGLTAKEARRLQVSHVQRSKDGELNLLVSTRTIPLSIRVDLKLLLEAVDKAIEEHSLAGDNNFNFYIDQKAVLYHMNSLAQAAGLRSNIRSVELRWRGILDMYDSGLSPAAIGHLLGLREVYVRNLVAKLEGMGGVKLAL